AFFLYCSTAAAASDPAALWQAIESSRLVPEKAVTVKSLSLEAGLTRLEIEEGTIFPATPVGGRVAEMVFVGQARLVLEPPDDIEAAQLELFTD
ncbi:MAG: hypothetical protein GWN99_00890, partial [Gemmatimonadetes bacterium]|nr:hypothetical protein [Gemmatimonadota bacterium]NIR99623.1 hypothetical protein [Gemmatimonadota bacterium]NIT68296.1 hypothetical protein [Gemmatimonadota bacterium]NIV22507.1 hypothetical protein [Gemmatimonadota bacterium]NIW74350.1 hypothetical protein [Gemmatimonadota bacterium]